MGGFYDVVDDASQVFHNPALTTCEESTVFQCTVENRFGMSELTNRNIVAVTPFSIFHVGAGFSLFGVPTYQNQAYSGTIAIHISSKSSVGIRAAWYQTRIPLAENASLAAPLIGAGWYYAVSPQWAVGMQLSIFSKKLYQIVPFNLTPAFISASCSWKPLEIFSVSIGAETNYSKKMKMRSGLDWRVAKVLALRTGITGNPSAYYVGFGIYHKAIVFDFAVEHHQILGYSPSLSLSYIL